MRAGGRILMIFGLVLAIIAGVATFIVLRASPEVNPEEDTGPTLVSVVVALQPIEPWQEIPVDALTVREYPEPLPDNAILAEMPAGTVIGEPVAGEPTPAADATPPAGGETEEGEGEPVSGLELVSGKISNTRIYPGQVIVRSQLVDKQLQETLTGVGSNASYIIPDGKVAVAIPITQISSVAGALKAGDVIDILVTMNIDFTNIGIEEVQNITQLTLQKVPVLRVGPWSVTDDEKNAGGIVTVIVEPQEAVEIKYIRDNTVFDFALRSITDESDFVTRPVNVDYLVEQYNFLP